MPYLLSCDIHTHTMFSAHAYSTIEENVYWAAERGLRSYQFFINQDIWPRIWSGVLVLRGAEADIVSLDGSLFGEDTPVTLDIAGDSYSRQHSLFDLVTRNLDYLVASVHNPQIAEGATLAQTTEMYINALEHPKVFMLGHAGRSGVPFDIDEVLLAAKAKHKIIEINNHSLEHGVDTEHWAVCRKIAERCAGKFCEPAGRLGADGIQPMRAAAGADRNGSAADEAAAHFRPRELFSRGIQHIQIVEPPDLRRLQLHADVLERLRRAVIYQQGLAAGHGFRQAA